MSLKDRVDRVFERYGEGFLINGTTAARGIFQVLDQNRMNAYFDSIEQSSILKPALIATVPADTPVALNNTVARDGRTYTVKKIARQRVKDEVVFQLLLLV